MEVQCEIYGSISEIIEKSLKIVYEKRCVCVCVCVIDSTSIGRTMKNGRNLDKKCGRVQGSDGSGGVDMGCGVRFSISLAGF